MPKVLIKFATNAKFKDREIYHDDEPEIVKAKESIVPVQSMMRSGSRLAVRTASGDVWPVSAASHKDYDFVALAG